MTSLMNQALDFLLRIRNSVESHRLRQIRARLGSCGDRVWLAPQSELTAPERIHLGHNVHIDRGAWLSALHAEIRIGNYVMFGPECALICGNHNITEVGRPMYGVKNKRPEDDQPITIEDDVWLGFRVTVLKGVTIGRGSVVGANSVVTKNLPPYSIASGNPARVRRFRFDLETIRQHEQALYTIENRLSANHLEKMGAPHRSSADAAEMT